MELNKLLTEIKRETVNLRTLFLSEEERNEIRAVLDSFDQSMQATLFNTVKNMEEYRQYGWKELYGGEENNDDGSEQV